jgi:SAM-dependent methyltransferase
MGVSGERLNQVGGPVAVADAALRRHMFPYVHCAMSLHAGSVVLDAACGLGYGSAELSRRGFAVGVDKDRDALNRARSRYGGASCAFVACSIERLPFKDSSFSHVCSFQTLEHMDDDVSFLRELNRVSIPQGVIYATTPNRLLRLRSGQRPWNRFHVREYSPEEFRRTLSSVFAGVEVSGVMGSAEVMELEARRIAAIQRADALDPLHLRAMMPEWLRYPLAELGKRLMGLRAQSAAALGDVGFSISAAPERALDLLGTGRRAAA